MLVVLQRVLVRGVVREGTQKESRVDNTGDLFVPTDVRHVVQLAGDVVRAIEVPRALRVAKEGRHGAPDGGETLRQGGHSPANQKITMAKPFEI